MSGEAIEKEFPRNYPTSVVEVLEAMSLSDGKGMRVIGSASLRSIQFAGDYDANETVSGTPAKVAKGLQGVIRRLRELPNVVIGDIKCGGTMADPLRWTPAEIIAGKNGHTSLEEAVAHDAMRKVDTVAFVDGRYVEVSVVYLFAKEEISDKVLIDELKTEIKDKLSEGNYWKALKRFFSIQRLTNQKKAEAMTPIFNGDLGRLYSVLSDITTLLYMLENKKGKTELIQREVDSFRSRLSNIWRLKEFIKKEPEFDKALTDAVEHPGKLEAILSRLSKHFDAVLQGEAKHLVKKWGVK